MARYKDPLLQKHYAFLMANPLEVEGWPKKHTMGFNEYGRDPTSDNYRKGYFGCRESAVRGSLAYVAWAAGKEQAKLNAKKKA